MTSQAGSSHVVDVRNVRGMVSQFEENTTTAVGGQQKDWKPKYEPCLKVLRSRYVGFLMGPLYALILYYYIAYLILDPYTTAPAMMNTTASPVDTSVIIDTGVDATSDITGADSATLDQQVRIYNIPS